MRGVQKAVGESREKVGRGKITNSALKENKVLSCFINCISEWAK